MPRCKATTAKGKQCSYSAKEDSDYCGIHRDNNAGRPLALKDVDYVQIEKLCKLGATDADLADFYQVSEKTINEQKKRDPEFLQSIKKGKEVADAEVADRLFKRATGYEHDAVKIMNIDGQVQEVPYTKHYAPDTTAAIFWLKNRRKRDWRDSKNIDHTSAGEKVDGFKIVIEE